MKRHRWVFGLDSRKKALLDVFEPSLDWRVSISI